MSSAASIQARTGLGLVRSGVSLQLAGLLWGIVVGFTPFPRLALTAHIQMMAEGAMILLAGLVVSQPKLVKLSPLQSNTVYWGLATVWVTMAAEAANAYWGTKEVLPQAAAQAGALGGTALQEMIVTLAHFIPAFALILSLAVLVVALFSDDGKEKEV